MNQGYVITDRLACYNMPSIVQTPEIPSIVVEHPTSEGPYGAKGVGEIVSIPTTPVITNAILQRSRCENRLATGRSRADCYGVSGSNKLRSFLYAGI
ncbi:MAG: hypothetical protein QGM50_06780 [Anaerolineae bacterium]|nr:hypothetical protein [Anaerolineae bacterium]